MVQTQEVALTAYLFLRPGCLMGCRQLCSRREQGLGLAGPLGRVAAAALGCRGQRRVEVSGERGGQQCRRADLCSLPPLRLFLLGAQQVWPHLRQTDSSKSSLVPPGERTLDLTATSSRCSPANPSPLDPTSFPTIGYLACVSFIVPDISAFMLLQGIGVSHISPPEHRGAAKDWEAAFLHASRTRSGRCHVLRIKSSHSK